MFAASAEPPIYHPSRQLRYILAARMQVRPGASFDRYTIEALIGEGGMGRVYRAHDQRLRRRVALKLLRLDREDRTAVVRLLHEARAAAALDHPGSVAIFDVGEFDGVPFIAMEYVVGRSLRELVGDAGVAVGERLRWLQEVARVLAVAHAAGLVHRDIKPENVMVRADGAVKVLDFGIARHLDDDPEPLAELAGAGEGRTFEESELCGTPAYMAPEQVQGREVDGRADQFAWGVLAYELLSGALPWQSAREGVTTRVAVVTERQARLSPLLGVSSEVVAAVDRALEKDPERRFRDMGELLAALEPGRRRRRQVSAPDGASFASDWTLFVGRGPELAALRGWLAEGKRLVSIVGPPGVGKTRLARVAAGRELAPLFAGRLWFVDGADASTPADLVHATLRALGVSMTLEVGEDASLEPLAATLAGLGRAAIVFDGIDRIVARHADALGKLLARAPELRMVVTSRARLLVRGEQVLELGPLAVPAEGETDAEAEAVALFVDRALAVRPGYRVDADELLRIGELVRRLDGLPQAIELAAARLTVLDLRGLLLRLERDRGDAIGAAIEASWALLDIEERSVLAQCSVFRGGFDLDAAEAVLVTGGEDVWVVLERLRHRSLLAAREGGDAGRLRFFVYRSIREFAADRLVDVDAVWRRHAGWYATRAQVIAGAARVSGGAAALAALALERENLRAVIERVDPAVDGEALALAVLAVDPLAHAEGGLAEQLRAIDRALAGASGELRGRLVVARARALHALGRGDEALGMLAGVQDAEALLVAAEVHAGRGEWGVAGQRASEARALGEPVIAGLAGLLLASGERHAGQLVAAAEGLRAARAQLLGCGARVDAGRAALGLARVHAALGAGDEALRCVAEASGLLVGAADPRLHAAARAAFADVALGLGRGAEARAAGEEALQRQRELGDTSGQTATLAVLAGVQLDEEDPEAAEQLARVGLALAGGERARLLWIVALARWDRGQLDVAALHARDGMAAGDRGLCAATVGAIEASRGRATDAAQAFARVGEGVGVESVAATLAVGFDELRRARELAARSQRQAADAARELVRARLVGVLGASGGVALTGRSFAVRAIARRLHRALTPRDRALVWAAALDPNAMGVVLDRATRAVRLPGGRWIDGHEQRARYRVIAALARQRVEGPESAELEDVIAALGEPAFVAEIEALPGLVVDRALAPALAVHEVPGTF